MRNAIELWKKYSSPEIKTKIENMSEEDLRESFSTELEFGTAGIRGIIGIGPNKMNNVTIAKATYGYGKYIMEKFGHGAKVVIGTDNRHKRNEFLETASHILSSMGIEVYKQTIIPTPLVSFAIRELNASGGIIITASHNPSEYNGFKVYDEKGGQLLPKETNIVLNNSSEIEEFVSFTYEADESIIYDLPKTVLDKYKDRILSLDSKTKKDLTIVFSPQHGTSANFLPAYLSELGYKVICVDEQMTHDPDFSNTPSPNPENPEAYSLAFEYAKKNNADIVITTDPDADRIGVAALKDGEYKIINGNEFAEIVFADIVGKEDLPDNPLMVYSYVSSGLPNLIAEKHGIKSVSVATGFKWVSKMIEKYSKYNFVFGFEESYGCLLDGSIARDKDSFQAAVKIADIANNAKQNGKSLWDKLEDVYTQYGYFKGKTITKEFKGIDSNRMREEFISKLRTGYSLPTNNKYKTIDLKDGMNDVSPMNMIRFEFDDGSWIGARPSGTEPKIKFYFIAGPAKKDTIDKKYNELYKIVEEMVK